MVSFRLLLPFLSHLLAQAQVAKNSAAQRSLTFTIKNRDKWPNNEVHYRFANSGKKSYPDWTQAKKDTFKDAVAEVQIQLDDCIQFFDDTTAQASPDYIKVTAFDKRPKKCYASPIGWSALGQNVINIPTSNTASWSCSPGSMKHELLHALGLAHSHQHPDRDAHVQYTGTGTAESTLSPNDVEDFGMGYDAHSIMHYSPYTSLDPNFDNSISIGQRDALSVQDIAFIKQWYGCPASSTSATSSTSSASPPPAQLPQTVSPRNHFGPDYHHADVSFQTESGRIYRVVKEYEALEGDDLSLKVDDHVEVLARSEDWIWGSKNQTPVPGGNPHHTVVAGWFPATEYLGDEVEA